MSNHSGFYSSRRWWYQTSKLINLYPAKCPKQWAIISGNTHVPLKERWQCSIGHFVWYMTKHILPLSAWSLLLHFSHVHSIFLAHVTATLRAVDFEMSNIVQSNVIWQVRQMSTINLSSGIRYSCLEETESDVPPKINMRNCVGGHCTMNSPSCHDRDVECIGEKVITELNVNICSNLRLCRTVRQGHRPQRSGWFGFFTFTR